MKIQPVQQRSPRIEMLPLIDVVFLLLVVFIFAMLSMAVHKGLPVALPDSATAQTDRRAPISVTVAANGDIFVDKAAVALTDLRATLRRRTADERQTGVLLFADRTLAYQDLFRVLDQIRLAGVSRISLQAQSEGTP
jgi:biopolymer transport protein ExbD